MKERPILMSAPMVRAILEGRKTQTRRIIKPQPVWGRYPCESFDCWVWEKGKVRLGFETGNGGQSCLVGHCPHGQAGDRLWVRESFRMPVEFDHVSPGMVPHGAPVQFPYTVSNGRAGRNRPSIHMPRWASRIYLEIVSVKVERLNDISEDDARAEGVSPNWCGDIATGRNSQGGEGWTENDGWERYGGDVDGFPCFTAKDSYQTLWDHINGTGVWNADPWVFVLGFKRV